MTHVTDAPRTTSPADTRPLARLLLLWVPALTALYVALQVIASRSDDKASIRDAWLSDSIAVLVASLLFGGIAAGLALWAMRGDASRQSRTVVGLAVFAVVLSPIGWWSAAPILVAVCAVLLGRTTGVTDRETGSSAARTASIVATMLAVGLVLFTASTLVVENL